MRCPRAWEITERPTYHGRVPASSRADASLGVVRAVRAVVRALARRPSPRTVARIALAAVIANIGIVVSGGAVRLTQSGLGCPTWPRCTGSSLVPQDHPGTSSFHMAVEFGNRLVTFIVLGTAIACVVAALRMRPRRRDLVRLAWLQPLGIAAQIVLGGITVLVDLNPAAVASHFMLSMGIIAATVALYVRAGEGDMSAVPTTGPELRWLARALVPVVLLLLAAGTVVTGTGPHAGDASSPRFGFSIEQVAQLHVDLVWVTVGLTFALVLATRLTGGHRALLRAATVLLGLELAQGVVGYTQYFLGDPAAIVALHVLGSALVWAVAVRTAFTVRARDGVPTVDLAAGPAPAADSALAAGAARVLRSNQRSTASTATITNTSVR